VLEVVTDFHNGGYKWV